MTLRILHTNDLHGTLTQPKAERLRELRQGADLYFDSGDCIKAGNLGIPLRQEQAWDLLDLAGCDASTLGNRETHVLESAFAKKLSGVLHPLICANVRRKSGEPFLEPVWRTEIKGIRIAAVGVMVPMVTEKMATAHASAFLWDPPIQCATDWAKKLHGESDLLIALTHIGFVQDKKLAETCSDFDVIFGGHSHTVLDEPVLVNRTWIAQGGSHGRFIGSYEWNENRLVGGLIPW